MVVRQILFIQGGGADVHDEWENKLADSLRVKLGFGYQLSYPRRDRCRLAQVAEVVRTLA